MKKNITTLTTIISRSAYSPFALWGVLALMLTAVLTLPHTAISQWSSDPKVNTLVSNAANDQINPASVSDGSGGAIVVWQDKRAGNNDNLYAQRVNARGDVQWTANGVSICLADSDQINPVIISDGSHGAIIAWQDKRNGSYDIYAQRVSASGTLLWSPATGDSVCKVVFNQVNICMVSDGSGGALLTWEDYRSNAGPGLADVYAQKMNATGVPQWTANGVAVCTQGAAQFGPRIISDGAGGAFLTWYDHRAGNYDVYAQRVSNIGGLVGTVDGVAVCTIGTDQMNPDLCSDGAGGAIIVWQDFRSTTSVDIWVQAMTAAVAIRWPVNGVVMNNNVAYDQINPRIVSDGIGGALMTWEDFRTGITSDIYAQRVNSSGLVSTGWNVNGIAVCVSANNQSHPAIISDSSNGAIITWEDKRSSGTNGNTYDVYASRISGLFVLPWTANGVAICTADSNQSNPTIVTDTSGGAIVAWQDDRHGNYDIYASQVNQNGVNTVKMGVNTTPARFTLLQNYPNPFNPATSIAYTLPAHAAVTLKVYNIFGQEVKTLVNGMQDAGYKEVTFDASELSSGVYFYALRAGSFTDTKRMVLLK